MVLAVVGIFVACQLPYHVMELWSLEVREGAQKPTIEYTIAFMYFNTLAQILVFISSCCNPIVYGIFNKNYSELIASHYYIINRGIAYDGLF